MLSECVGVLFYLDSEHDSFIWQKAFTPRDIPWHLLCSGTRQKGTIL